jgi:hypothetical protein
MLIKGRDYYDLLWFMQQRIEPLAEKLEYDGTQPYDVKSAMLALQGKIEQIRPRDLSIDLLPLFEQRTFIEAWIDSFHENFNRLLRYYSIKQSLSGINSWLGNCNTHHSALSATVKHLLAPHLRTL